MGKPYQKHNPISDEGVKILSDIFISQSKNTSLSVLKINNVELPVPFSIDVKNAAVIARSTVIDGGEIFERISTKAAEISLSGVVYVDTKMSNVFVDRFNEAENNAAELVNRSTIFYENITKPKMVLPVVNVYLNALEIDSIIVQSTKVTPLSGQCGFSWSIDCVEAVAVKSKLGDTLIIS